MKKIMFVLCLIVLMPVMFATGCALLDMSSDEQKDFLEDCAVKGLLVQITIDPLNDEQVQIECVPRVIIVPVTPDPATIEKG